MKGLAQIDYAVAVGVTIVVVVFIISYITNYASTSISPAKTAELKSIADTMQKILLDSSGWPADWENYNRIPIRVGLSSTVLRIPITVREIYGKARVNEPVDVHVVLDQNCQILANNNSIRLFDNSLTRIPFQIYNATQCFGNYTKEANIVFKTNLSVYNSSTYWLFISNKTMAPIAYPQILSLWDYFNPGESLADKWQTANAVLSGGKVTVTYPGYILSKANFIYKTLELYSNISNSSIGFNYSSSIGYCVFEKSTGSSAVNCKTGAISSACGSDGGNYTWRIAWNSSSCSYFKNDSLAIVHTTNVPTTPLFVNITPGIESPVVVDWVKVWENDTQPNSTFPIQSIAVSAPSISVVSEFKIRAMQNLTYEDTRRALGITNHFNLTLCGYSFGRAIPQAANVISYQKAILYYNSTGDVTPCIASLKVW